MDLREIGWDGRDWIDLAQDRDQWMAIVNTVMNLRVLLSDEYPATELLSTVNSTIAPSLLTLPCRARLNCQPSTNWVAGWWQFHTNLLVFSSQADFQLTTELDYPNCLLF
jgi:hypothetical protein